MGFLNPRSGNVSSARRKKAASLRLGVFAKCRNGILRACSDNNIAARHGEADLGGASHGQTGAPTTARVIATRRHKIPSASYLCLYICAPVVFCRFVR
jgi:hypothetical protein